MKSPYSFFISVDTETGGIPNAKQKAVYDVALTEVALVAISKDLEIVDQKSWLIKPYKEGLIYNIHAEQASGISKAMTEEQGVDLMVAVKEMIVFLKKYKDGSSLPLLFGHNFDDFDGSFMINAFEFCKEDLFKYVKSESQDTIRWARLCWVESLNYKNGTCCQNAGITLQDAHRALPDALATGKLWIFFMKRLRGIAEGVVSAQTVVRRFRDGFEL